MSKCSEEGCVEFRFDQEAALREGWDLVDEELFCPMHSYHAARVALAKAELDDRKAKISQERAKKSLTAGEYRKWDEFQSDLADYHKNHGKLAPAVLRTLDPKKWLAEYGKTGRIDVELVAESLDANERRAMKTRRWLTSRVE